MLLGASLIQWSAAIVTHVFGQIGPSATSAWRFFLGAAVLLAFTRPNLRTWTKQQWLGALALGKRSARHFAFVVLAGLGVLAIARPGAGLDYEGVLFAAGSGLGWASYVFAAHRVGGQAEGFGGLAVSMSIAALVTLPLTISSSHYVATHPATLGRLALVAVMAIVLGFACELQALRRLKPSTAGVLFALDPAVAFAVGLIVLSQSIHPWDLVGMVCVVIAGAGVTYDAANSKPTLVQ
jgi:inner membrane transporter RhtA